ncbi:unnamed protein product [Alopecurus aequalis]
MPNCTTSCGSVEVPYPFGIGPSASCYLQQQPGFNLTCDTSVDPPRLLLPGSDLRVQSISGATVGVFHTVTSLNISNGSTAYTLLLGSALEKYSGARPYRLQTALNELVVTGCNVQATLLRNENIAVGSCFSFCYDGGNDDDSDDWEPLWHGQGAEKQVDVGVRCAGVGCCRAPIVTSLQEHGDAAAVYSIKLDWFGQNSTADRERAPVRAFVAADGWFDYWLSKTPRPSLDHGLEVLVSLDWRVVADKNSSEYCSSSVCRSDHSVCVNRSRGYACICDSGYTGNPYIPDGCQVLGYCADDVNWCYGECISREGTTVCQCPPGTHGNAAMPGGCFNSTIIDTGKCTRWCGGVLVPYPFGIKGISPDDCYHPGLNLTCDTTQDPPRLHLSNDGALQVVEIYPNNATMRVAYTGTFLNATSMGLTQVPFGFPSPGEAPYSLSTSNELILTGCDAQVSLHGAAKGPNILGGCVSFCSANDDDEDDGKRSEISYADLWAGQGVPRRRRPNDKYCHGVGCCQAQISTSMDGMPEKLHLGWLVKNFEDKTPPPTYVFIAEEGWFDELAFSGELGPNLQPPSRAMRGVPIVLQWEVLSSDQNCTVGNICKSKHSNCKQGDRGYRCHCEKGYDGNPYVDDSDGCNAADRRKKIVIIGISIGVGLASAAGLIISVLIGCFISNKVKHQKAQMLKRKFFEQNRGQLLQQLVSQRADIAERMIIPLEELEKATNNFDKARELGSGGHGTVYKGILSDLHVVAIKKPKKVVQREIGEFINEVAVLSQINHRNVVKLYGCCLETEVPILVYEFISNGTLYDHLHINGPRSLPWDDRLRIAIETAKSLAYLHSTASMPIIHRDVKSANILLDDTLTAKVADFGASKFMSVEKSGLSTMVQGTPGYLDPNYFYTGRLTEKSDVYSYGVMLVELLTRKKPFSYLSFEGEGLVARFVTLFAEGGLSEILDPQVMDEGRKEVEEAVALAVACIKLRGEDRPTMRQVELALEGLRPTKEHILDDFGANKLKKNGYTMNSPLTLDGRSCDGSTRQYSMELELNLSSRYPRS